MLEIHHSLVRWIGRLFLLALVIACVGLSAYGKRKDKQKAQPAEDPNSAAYILEHLDYSKIVWPNPPAITRIKFLSYYTGEPLEKKTRAGKKKGGWMDRLAGVTAGDETAQTAKPRFVFFTPYGLAVDSKNRLYVADARVGAIFVINTDTKEVELIKNGVNAKFADIIGLAIDDDDRVFVSDSQLHHVLVLSPKWQAIASISEGMTEPAGVAIDRENRFLYVADTGADQVLVYDADSLQLLRKIGTTGKKHELNTPGNFAKPTNVAVDKDGNLYVSDTLNDRVEIFDADGNFISTFGKAGDGPGYFARPKGIAVDGDGHIWVADALQDRVQVFDKEGKLLIWMGGNGLLPGQFSALTGLAIDKNNRVFTSEQYPGRVQAFRYITQGEALAEYKRREAAKGKDAPSSTGQSGQTIPSTAAPSTAAPISKESTPAEAKGSAANSPH